MTLQDSFTMGDSELTSQPTVTYQASGDSKTYTISDLARKTITLTQDGLEAELTTDAGDNVYPGEKIHLTLTLKNTGSNGYTGLDRHAGGRARCWLPTWSWQRARRLSRRSNGRAVQSGRDCRRSCRHERHGRSRFRRVARIEHRHAGREPGVGARRDRAGADHHHLQRTRGRPLRRAGEKHRPDGRGDPDRQRSGYDGCDHSSLPSGESRTLVFDLETSIAGQIQFEVAGKDAAGNDKAYDSNIIFLTYVEPTPEPTATPAPTAVPPTPTPEPTATPVPTIGDIIAQHVNPVVLYTIAGVLAAVIVALVAVSSVSGAKRKKRMERAIDTIELSPDVRDSFGKRRRRAQNVSAKAGKTLKRKPSRNRMRSRTTGKLCLRPNLSRMNLSASTAAKNAPHKTEEGENHRRRTPQNVPTDKTLRVAPVEERPEFTPQGKVDDSKTRIFGKLDMENAVKEEQKKAEEAPKAETAETAPEAGQETIRLSGEDVQKLKTQVREDHFGVKGKKRDEIKPMKKGLFGFGKKNDDDDFLIDSDDDGDDDDDLFE
ncbi:MAG: hypothetical protein ACLR4A_16990 [Christensenellales bacterium]